MAPIKTAPVLGLTNEDSGSSLFFNHEFPRFSPFRPPRSHFSHFFLAHVNQTGSQRNKKDMARTTHISMVARFDSPPAPGRAYKSLMQEWLKVGHIQPGRGNISPFIRIPKFHRGSRSPEACRWVLLLFWFRMASLFGWWFVHLLARYPFFARYHTDRLPG